MNSEESSLDFPATIRQKIKIAQLCVALKIKAPVEDIGLTIGEAGTIIRRLSNLLKHERSKL